MIIAFAVILATYRLATDLAWERGPFDAYSKMRGRVITCSGAHDWLADGVTCPVCWSFWLSALAAIVVVVVGSFDPWLWPLWWLSVAGAVAFLVRLRA